MIKNKLYRKLIGLSDYVKKLYDQDYFNNASIVTLDCYRAFFKFFLDNFDEIDVSLYDDIYIFLNIELVPEMRFVQRTKTSNIPWSLIPNLDEILKNELGPEYMLLFRPQWKYNYSVITTDLVEELTQLLVTFFPTKEVEINTLFPSKKIHIFSFPFLEKTNVLLDSVIGHEIGHFFHNKWQKEAYALSKIAEFNKSLASKYKIDYPGDLLKPYEMTNEGISIINGMYREIISDIIGYKIFGPSILFALYDIASFETKLVKPSKKTNYYPLTKYRIRVLFERLIKNDKELLKLTTQKNECSEIANAYFKEIEDYLVSKDDLATLASCQTEVNLFEDTFNDLIAYADANISRNYFSTEKTNVLYGKLLRDLPINEDNNVPNDMTSILFAGWLMYYKINRDLIKDEYVTQYQILMRLLMKSLYSSYVNTQYLIQKANE